MDGAVDTVRHIVEITLLAVAALLPIVDPLSSSPMYLQFTRGLDSNERVALARTVARHSFMLLLGSAFIGAYVLDFFGLSIPAVQIAGGLLLCAMAWELLKRSDGPETASRAPAAEAAHDAALRRAFYPLTMPLTVGPGSISVAVALGANPSRNLRALLVTTIGHALGILIVSVSVYLCYRYADRIATRLGDTGRTVMTRLSAFILLCIGVQIAWNGVQALLAGAFPLLIERRLR
jgi:multiple antibiotic resistance protein